MYKIPRLKYKDTVELKLKWTTKLYHNKKEKLSIRFDNAYFLFLEQRMKGNTFIPKALTSQGDIF